MNRSTYFRAIFLCLLIASGLSLSGVQAQPRAQEQGYTVYLPLAQGGPKSPSPTPTPPPPTRNGFFALHDWLTYNAATAVDVNGGVHLAFSVSDEKHQDDPSG